MPTYVFKHPKKEKYIEVVQKMDDLHEYVDKRGQKWQRVFHAPNFAIDSKIDPHSAQDFLRATASKKGTIGDLIEYSKEMSERRGGEDKDPIIQKRNREYKARHGVEHASVIKKKKVEKAKARAKKLGFHISE